MLPVRDSLPTRTWPVVNYLLIAANIAVFVQELRLSASGNEEALAPWVLVPAELVADPIGSVPSLFGHMFLHGGLGHIAGNMLFLWIFGDNVEDALGHVRYFFFYLLCGFGAAAAQVAMMPQAMVPMVGASGAIAGVLAAYLRLYPRSPITILNPIPLLWLFWGLFLQVPAWFVIIEFIVFNLWNAFHVSAQKGGVAFFAHVGGFFAGLLLLPLLRAHAPVDSDRWSGLVPPGRRR
jgi:membrane associated rhomboid family serine protease